MTALWFGLALACLAGAAALLYLDKQRRQRSGRVRQTWAKSHGYSYKAVDSQLAATWRRATLAKQGYLSAVDIATGSRRGVRFTVFDLEDSATVVAVQRRIGSEVDIDMRLKTTPPPKDPDLELLGAMGDRVIFASDLDIARRVCDQRMAALAEILPENLQVLWSENDWTLGSLPVTATPRDWDQAIDGVIRFSGLLHVLPPADDTPPAPRRQPRLAPRPYDEPPIDPPRATRAPRWVQRAEEEPDEPGPHIISPTPAESGLPQRPGGPFHPGFRPYSPNPKGDA